MKRYIYTIMSSETKNFPDLVLVLDRLRSAHNTGNIFRIAEALGAGVAACGYTPCPPHPKLEKTAMGTDKTVPWMHFDCSEDAVDFLHAAGYTVFAAEPGGREAWEMDFPSPLAVIFGNEALGVHESAMAKIDGVVSLPMRGDKASVNVGNAAAAITYAIDAVWRKKNGSVL